MSELNLLPYHIKQNKVKKLAIVQGILVSVILVAILGAGVYLPYAKLNSLKTEEATLKASLDKDQKIKIDNENLKKQIAQLKDYTDKVDGIKNARISIYPVMKNIEKYIPKDVVITTFNFGKGIISINGTTKQYNSINEFLANLHESSEFSKSTVSSITGNDKTGEWTFTLTITDGKGEVK